MILLIDKLELVKQFRPISICNIGSKIITKIIINKIRPFMKKRISPFQASFIPGRRAMDNVVILRRVIQLLKRKKGYWSWMVLKLDLEKAYERLQWHFIKRMVYHFQFQKNMTDIIMECICSTSVSILLKDGKFNNFKPYRGICQGDPVSPYIFILCIDNLSYLIENEFWFGKWKPLKLGRNSASLSHLMFTHDLILIGETSMSNYSVII